MLAGSGQMVQSAWHVKQGRSRQTLARLHVVRVQKTPTRFSQMSQPWTDAYHVLQAKRQWRAHRKPVLASASQDGTQMAMSPNHVRQGRSSRRTTQRTA